MKIGAYQFPVTGNITENMSRILAAVDQAVREGVELLIFPECAVTGYPPLEIPSPDSVDEALVSFEAEETRLGIARLGQGSDRADLHKTKTEEAQHIDSLAVLVETGCKTDWVGKFDAKHLALKFFVIFLIQRPDERIENPDFLEHTQHSHREAVNLLRIEEEEYRPYYMLVHLLKIFCKDSDFFLVKNFGNQKFLQKLHYDIMSVFS